MAAALGGAAAVSLGVAARAARRRLSPQRLPLLGVLGGFVFAAQLLNFPVAPGVAGHLSGGALLAIVLGPAPAILTMGAVVLVQCFLFADGGMVALGANLVNLAVVAPLCGFAVDRLLRGRFPGLAAATSVLATSAVLIVELEASGAVPIYSFLAPMLGFHAIVAVIEGLATHAAVQALRETRPEIFSATVESP
jgi:cobalt/nickel transport system permease protein